MSTRFRECRLYRLSMFVLKSQQTLVISACFTHGTMTLASVGTVSIRVWGDHLGQ
mgnify:CR=1 FL=1